MANEQWSKTYGGWDDDTCLEVYQTYDDGYILFGYTWSYGAGSTDFWLLKTDSTGDSLWSKAFGGSDWDVGTSVYPTSDSGYILIGNTLSFGVGSYDYLLIKTDKNGDSLWTKTIGGIDEDNPSSIKQTYDGGYIITGYTESNVSSQQLWLIKTNSSGDTMWTETFGGASFEGGRAVDQSSDSGYIIIGYTHSYSAGSQDLWLLRTNSKGDLLWSQTFGGNLWDDGRDVQQTFNGNYIITGYFADGQNVNLWLIHTDSSFVLLNNEKFSTHKWQYELLQNYPNPFNHTTNINF